MKFKTGLAKPDCSAMLALTIRMHCEVTITVGPRDG